MALRRTVSDFIRGIALVFRGLRTWGTSPRLMAWGLLPGAITFTVMVAAWVAWAVNSGDVAAAMVSRLTDSRAEWVYALEIVVTLALLLGATLLAVYLFTAVTLGVGGPFFERLSASVDTSLGFEGRAPRESWWTSMSRSLRESSVRLVLTMATGVAAFLLALIPGVGGALAFTLTATVASQFLAMELVAIPAARRGMLTRAERSALLARRKALSRGYGVAVYLLFLIPGMAVMMMPAVVAGSTLLVRELTGEAVTRVRSAPRAPAWRSASRSDSSGSQGSAP